MNTNLDSTVSVSLRRQFFGLPSTRSGWWAVRLSIAFLVLFPLWFIYAAGLRPIPRPTFFSDPFHAVLILSAAVAAIGGAIMGVLALVAKGERSFTVLLSVFVGAFVLYGTVCELMGH